jgi:hypothetical protein
MFVCCFVIVLFCLFVCFVCLFVALLLYCFVCLFVLYVCLLLCYCIVLFVCFVCFVFVLFCFAIYLKKNCKRTIYCVLLLLFEI